jgi:hypothetical protein
LLQEGHGFRAHATGELPSATDAIGYKIYFCRRLFRLTEPAGGMMTAGSVWIKKMVLGLLLVSRWGSAGCLSPWI